MMPEANQYSFTHKEIVELMIKKAGVHEGKWMLQLVFGFAVVNGGPAPEQMIPCAVAGVQSVGIQKAVAESPPSMVVDAAEVNPSPSAPSGKAKRKIKITRRPSSSEK